MCEYHWFQTEVSQNTNITEKCIIDCIRLCGWQYQILGSANSQ